MGDGRYTAPMTLAPDPRQNAVEIAGKHYAPLVKYLGATGGDVDPATVDPATLALTRVKDPRAPGPGRGPLLGLGRRAADHRGSSPRPSS